MMRGGAYTYDVYVRVCERDKMMVIFTFLIYFLAFFLHDIIKIIYHPIGPLRLHNY